MHFYDISKIFVSYNKKDAASVTTDTVFYQLEKAIKTYRKMAQDHIQAAGFDISVNQLILMIQLAQYPESSQVELSEAIFKDFASVARMVDLLVKKGYLNRSENRVDRRKKDLIPTAKGKKIITALVPVIQNYRQVALGDFTSGQLRSLSALLSELTNNCEQAMLEKLIQ